MTRIRSLLARAAAPFIPAPGSTEGAVMLGLVLLAAGFAVAGHPALSLIVPGATLVAIGALPAFRGRS